MMRTAQVLILLALLTSEICGHKVTKWDVEASLYSEVIKNKTKNTDSGIKSKLGFDDEDDASEARLYYKNAYSVIKSKLRLARSNKKDCTDQAKAAVRNCLGEFGVFNDNDLMACMVANIYNDCHESYCEAFATNPFLRCPEPDSCKSGRIYCPTA